MLSCLYTNYKNEKLKQYIVFFNNIPAYKNELTGSVKLENIIKESPKEVVMIVKWGDDDVYVKIENWFTKTHDIMEIRVFDKKKSYKLYE